MNKEVETGWDDTETPTVSKQSPDDRHDDILPLDVERPSSPRSAAPSSAEIDDPVDKNSSANSWPSFDGQGVSSPTRKTLPTSLSMGAMRGRVDAAVAKAMMSDVDAGDACGIPVRTTGTRDGTWLFGARVVRCRVTDDGIPQGWVGKKWRGIREVARVMAPVEKRRLRALQSVSSCLQMMTAGVTKL